ncbi:3-methyladenine DNA glycosylase [Arthrobacter sp. Bi83]|uniref:3-methyladenine DNA glycosylase n=1 Tax=Arthrobacter sp. Bi83 TaxID=2822353 RepID=UPI001E44F8BC|nr:3-methyladenine DNA glycosylase [Arthrobacter sp. Bi83]
MQLQVLPAVDWLEIEAAHARRVRRYADPYLARRSAGRKHPVEDFLFTYYTQKPGQLMRWHPGAGVVLSGAEAAPRRDWKYYRGLDDGELSLCGLPPGSTAVTLDRDAFLARRREALVFAQVILAGTAARPAQFGCFGLHEWAMVYRQDKFELRHEYLKLRLGEAGTDKVVEENRIRCSHFDAFRFYTPDALPLNELSPSRENQLSTEQPGCLHANMDLYKWAYKLSPALPGELVMDCFELSWRVRAMDMQASPYDLAEWGYPPIRIETAEGKASYVEHQRAFSAEAQILRGRLLEALKPLFDSLGPESLSERSPHGSQLKEEK